MSLSSGNYMFSVINDGSGGYIHKILKPTNKT